MTEKEYQRQTAAIRKLISYGDTYQVNFTCRLRSQINFELWNLFLDIAGDESAPFAAFVNTGKWVICSASPELFLKIDGRLYTPPVCCELLPETERAWLIDQGRLREKVLRIEKVLESKNIYLLNSVRGMDKAQICPHSRAHRPM